MVCLSCYVQIAGKSGVEFEVPMCYEDRIVLIAKDFDGCHKYVITPVELADMCMVVGRVGSLLNEED